MDHYYKSIKKVFFFCLVFCLSSCFLKKDPPNVDSFYTTKGFGDIPLLPLVKPILISYDRINKFWGIGDVGDMLQLSFLDNHTSIDSIRSIGVEGNYIYGNTHNRVVYIDKYTKEKVVCAMRSGGLTIGKKSDTIYEDEIRIYPIDSTAIDSTAKQFILPERMFVIHPPDSTLKVFFEESKYKDYLKEKGISGKMYDLDTMHAVYLQKDTLPWFPKEVKDKIVKAK